MTLALLLTAAALVSVGLGLYLTPIVRAAAIRFNVVDNPDGRLKTHAQPTPYLGGLAIYIAFVITLCLVFDFESRLMGLLLGGTLIAMLGLFDDLRVLPPGIKVLAQVLATWVAVKSGIQIDLVFLPGWANILLTFLWLLTITNAFNLIDVSDGLCASTALIALLAFFGNALWNHDHLIAVSALALAGAVAGFLRYNWAPARMYLGDTGSMFLGFMTGALAMIGRYTSEQDWAAIAPLCVLSVPLFDTFLVIVARLANGRSPFLGSPDHFAVRLKHHGYRATTVAWLGAGLSLLGTAMAIGVVHLPEAAAAAVVALWLAALGLAFIAVWRRPPHLRHDAPVSVFLPPASPDGSERSERKARANAPPWS